MDTKKTLSMITAGVLSLAMCGTLVSKDLLDTPEVEAVSEMSAIELVNDMGMGWNLGNTFDCTNITWLTPSKPSDIETAWGNPSTTKAMISKIHEYGFETVRIPVTWYQMTDSNYDINDDYLARIKEVVDWCQEEGMYAIINMHWDDCNLSEGGKNWLGTADSNFDAVQTKYTTMWNEISTYFADYDNKLIFESNNEPSITVDSLMKLNQDFVDTVRNTGGNNDSRLLLISSPETNLDSACSSAFSMPNDPANMQAVSIHYYYPATFCVATEGTNWGGVTDETTWGTESDINVMVNNFEKMKSSYTDKGIPVILGEYGVLTNDIKEDASIKKFLKSVATYSKAYDGMCGILWDSGNAGDMQYFDRKELQFFDSEIGNIYTELAGKDVIDVPKLDWVETEITTDDEGIVAVATQGATKIKVEASAMPYVTGTGVVGFWDNNANAWDQTSVYIRFDTDENGNTTISQTDSKYKEVLHDGYFELPDGVSTSSVQVQFYYSAYWDNDIGEMVEVDAPVLTKAYIPGVTSGDTTTEAPDVTTPAPDTTTEAPDVTTETSESSSVELQEPDFENLFGYVYPAFSNFMCQQWSIDGSNKDDTLPLLAQPVAITGNGHYSITINIPEDGAAENIGFLALESTLNSYQQNADEVEIFADMTFDIDSILVDGVEIEYVASENSLGTGNDGKSFRKTIYNDWTKPGIYDINNEIVNTESIVINFTIDGIVGGGEISSEDTTTSTSEEDVTTTSVSEEDVTTTSASVEDTTSVDDTTSVSEEEDTTTTTGGGSTTALVGDMNGDSKVNGKDLMMLKKYVLGLISADDISEQGMASADINGDSKVNGKDLMQLKKFVLGLIESL